jgi:prepilin-type processing-associated H-X9-DG protein
MAGAMGSGCSSKEEETQGEKEEKEKAMASDVSLFNIRAICRASVLYADAHQQSIPASMEDIKSFLKGGIMMESPKKPKDFDGPSYIFVKALSGKKLNDFKAPHEYVIVYENPGFCEDYINVGFLDGHEEKMTLAAFRKALEGTYKKLGEPMPAGS